MFNKLEQITLEKLGFKQYPNYHSNNYCYKILDIDIIITKEDNNQYYLEAYRVLYDDEGKYFVDLFKQYSESNQDLEEFLIENI